MESTNISKDKRDIASKDKLKNIKSDYILKKICNYLQRKKSLEIFKHNKNIQKRLKISINNYQEYSGIYSSIEIELIPIENRYGKFINIPENGKEYLHIYFNGGRDEIKNNKLDFNNKVSRIKIIIEHPVKSFQKLFKDCYCIRKISFKKFNRNNITNMSYMFSRCSSLKELKLSTFNTDNLTDMSYMFYKCSLLKELNISNFNTNNVTNMVNMFSYCSSLKELNLSNFNTNNVTIMFAMFNNCSEQLKIKMKSLNKFKHDAFV